MRIGLLNNLRAGRSERQVNRILGYLKGYPDILHEETDSAHAVPEALASLARREVDLLVVNGGDGTLQHALTEVLEQDAFPRVPLIAPLRGGRTNMTALDVGCHRDPVKGLHSVLQAVRDGSLAERIEPRAVLRVQSSNSAQAICGMFFGAGVIYRAVQLTHRVMPRDRQGVLGAGLVTGALMARVALRRYDGVLTPDKFQILIDREPLHHGEYTLVISSTLRRLFLKMRPFWGTGPGPLRFTAMASGGSRTGLAIPGIMRGRPRSWVTPEAGYVSRNAARTELRLDCGFTVDGELVDPQPDRTVTLTADRTVSFVRA